MRTLILFFLATIFITLFSCNSCNIISAGSYAYAEIYTIESNESKLISIIENFKKKNPEYNSPIELREGRDGKDDKWYHFYFYYKDRNEIVHFWIRQSSSNETTLALVGINEGLVLGHWRLINKDYSYKENKEQKRRFEERIFEPIKSTLKDTK